MEQKEIFERMARHLAIKGNKDDGPIPPFESLRGQEKFKDYPGDSWVDATEHKSNTRNELKIHWDHGQVVFGRDSGDFYDRIRVYYKGIMV